MIVYRNDLALEILKQNHCLIAGTTGSGKSTLLDTILYTLCTFKPSDKIFGIIDLKQISLLKWEYVPHCFGYARTLEGALRMVRDFSAFMDNRFQTMRKKRIDMWQGSDVYLIIDESADLLTPIGDNKKIVNEILGLLVHIGRLGRAAKCHMIFCTQAPDRKTIPSAIQQNCNAVVGLRCKSSLESRQIVGFGGCELLPRYGKGYFVSPDYMKPLSATIKKMNDEEIQLLLDEWAHSRIKREKNIYD